MTIKTIFEIKARTLFAGECTSIVCVNNEEFANQIKDGLYAWLLTIEENCPKIKEDEIEDFDETDLTNTYTLRYKYLEEAGTKVPYINNLYLGDYILYYENDSLIKDKNPFYVVQKRMLEI